MQKLNINAAFNRNHQTAVSNPGLSNTLKTRLASGINRRIVADFFYLLFLLVTRSKTYT